jgi:hypothetical protein
MAIFGWGVLALVFLDELLAMAAVGVWGWQVGDSTGLSLMLAIVLPVVAMIGWYFFASPKARFGEGGVRPIGKVVVFALATAALWASGHQDWALEFLAFSVVVNGLALLPSIKVLAAD